MRLTPDDTGPGNAPDVHTAEVPPGVIVFQKRRAVPVVVPDNGDMTMPPISNGNRPVVVSWPISCQPEVSVGQAEGVCSTTSTEGGSGAAGGMGQVVPFVVRDRPVAVPVESRSVVPFPNALMDRWDYVVAGIGSIPEVTDAQLRDVFLLMVAEMSGMVASKGGRGENTNEA